MKEELDQTESFKILQDAADGLRGIPDIHNVFTPILNKDFYHNRNPRMAEKNIFMDIVLSAKKVSDDFHAL